MKKSYLKFNLFFVCILLFSATLFAQPNASMWTKITKEKASIGEQLDRRSQPKSSNFYKLDIEALKTILQDAPERGSATTSNLIVSFPNVQGKLEAFKVMEASVMHEELQARYPDLRAYVAQSVENPSYFMRFTVTPIGLHAMTLGTESGTQYIDPYTTNGNYIVYSKMQLPSLDIPFECGVEEGVTSDEDLERGEAARNANDGTLRRYDLAMGSSLEYTNYHGGTKPLALQAMVVTVARVSGVYERELSIRMVLVANNDLLISTTGNVLFDNEGNGLNTYTGIISGIIGAANYDIGHVVSTGAGGVAGLGVVCNTSQKGRGTTGLPGPIGDAFNIDFVAHEIGHQFGGNHTFNGSTGNCAGGNRNGSTAYEPGSGSTIMAYAGICAPQNVQNSSNDYFHRISLNEIWARVSTGSASSCPTTTSTGNAAPTAEAGNSYNIPVSTPYKLVGASTDTDGTTSHTYTWEQFDLGAAGIPTDFTATGPMVRSIQGTTNPIRYIPRFTDVLANGGVSTTWEKLAAVGRVHTFQLTVRDNTMNGGQTASDAMTVTTVAGSGANAGPFSITSQNTNETWEVGSNQTVTWNVANTTLAPISTPNVNILMSIDGGFSFPYTLASNVPNDGSHSVNVPAGTATTVARIIVEGAGNIFYDINNSNFKIVNSEFVMTFSNSDLTVCQPNNAVYNFTYNTFSGFSENTTFSATGVPAGANVIFSPTNATTNGTAVTMTISNTAAVTPGSYTIGVVGTAASTTKTTDVTLGIFGTSLAASTLTAPANGATGISATPTLSWTANAGAQNYLVQISTNAGFTNIVNSETVTSNTYTPTSLFNNTLYYWRVTSSNTCATSSASAVFTFTTANITCDTFTNSTPVTIATNGVNYTSTINIPDDFPIVDVNVTINITHTWIRDITASITSPNGTTVILTNVNGANGAGSYTNTIFDQEATSPITGGTSPFAGSYIPQGDLSDIYGEMSGGNWVLTVYDNFPGDSGTLNSFGVNLCVQGTLGVEENEITDFLIFPNPNNGEFTVKFNSNSGEDIKIDVYDIRGRKVFNSKYENTSDFNEMIRLDNVQSGMYLMNVTDGLRTETKKIIIK